MKVKDIKSLQNEFKFISHVNELMSGIVYHAVRNEQNYEITIDSDPNTYKWIESESEFNRLISSGQYEIKTV